MRFYITNRFTMRTIKMLFSMITFCFTIVNVLGQNLGEPHQYNNLEKYYPKSPSVSSFEKFINIPQANYTGIHGYSVPVYTIDASGYSFPITINYHGLGVNINELSSVVGLGWDLVIGGINLSQEIRGYDDATSTKVNIENGYDFSNTSVEYNYNTDINNQSEQFYNAAKIAGGYYSGAVTYLLDTPPGKEYEFSPDYFNYSLLNNSGKFIIDKDGNFHTIPKDDVNIDGNIHELTIQIKKEYNITSQDIITRITKVNYLL